MKKLLATQSYVNNGSHASVLAFEAAGEFGLATFEGSHGYTSMPDFKSFATREELVAATVTALISDADHPVVWGYGDIAAAHLPEGAWEFEDDCWAIEVDDDFKSALIEAGAHENFFGPPSPDIDM